MPLITTTEMFQKAHAGGYAIGAFNVQNMEITQAIVWAARKEESPVILQISKGIWKYAGPHYAIALMEAAAKDAPGVDMAFHLDHGNWETCLECIDLGLQSVMIDASAETFEENVRITREVVDYAHARGVVVEGELGVLAGIEDDVQAEHHTYTEPDQVEDFVKKTGVDSLAISIGTSHGANKFKPEQCTRNAEGILVPPPLRFDILEEIEKRIPGFPIVLHGASSVPQDKVATINKYGGALKDAIGIPEDQLRRAAASAVCKINIDSDLRLWFTAAIREQFAENPGLFTPRDYLGPARELVQYAVQEKMANVLGSSGKI